MIDEIEDFVEEENISSNDLFDCEYTSIDAVIGNGIYWMYRTTNREWHTLTGSIRRGDQPLRFLH